MKIRSSPLFQVLPSPARGYEICFPCTYLEKLVFDARLLTILCSEWAKWELKKKIIEILIFLLTILSKLCEYQGEYGCKFTSKTKFNIFWKKLLRLPSPKTHMNSKVEWVNCMCDCIAFLESHLNSIGFLFDLNSYLIEEFLHLHC